MVVSIHQDQDLQCYPMCCYGVKVGGGGVLARQTQSYLAVIGPPGEKDKKKFDVARKLGKDHLHIIRKKYQQEWNSDDWDIRQRAVELYLIDKLALRVGIKGCCSLRVEQIKLLKEGRKFFVKFDFLGKGSIQYQNEVQVEKRVYENIKEFMEGKEKKHLLFHRVIPSELNSYLESHMLGLTASVFRTYNASITLQNKLEELTAAEDSIPSKVLAFKYAVRATAVLLNHRRAVPLAFDSQMANLQDKVKAKMTAIKNAKKDLKSVRNEYKQSRNEKMKQLVERKKKTVERLEDQLAKLKMKAKHKEDFKDVNIATTIGYYLDPLIIVAWCKKWDVPVKKVYNKSQRNKFRWAIDMAEKDYEF
ncbi:putative DNA topoisomerase 1 [Apostichopus japonicus]|uniref:DNA topoisomerase n=1 Tax=Stichopus japonicus TaxID=307972 RepID=A0A2G8LQU8_STIJA|nr:putative DNA topoisomerase 1 [Apostichopus japonicus]